MRAHLSRRELLALGAATSVGVLASCRSSGNSEAVLSSSPEVLERQPDVDEPAAVREAYRAAPIELDLAGAVASTWA